MSTDSRYRFRPGRRVRYEPTAAEATSDGEGPWFGQIVRVNADSTADLAVFPSVPATDAVLAVTGVSEGGTAGTFSFERTDT